MTEIEFRDPTPEELAEAAEAQAGEYARLVLEVEAMRQSAYQLESDPLFFKYQRSEDGVTKQAWLDKIDEIRERFPLPSPGE